LTYISYPDKIMRNESANRRGAGDFAALEDYDGYEFVFEQGYCARFEFKRDEARGAAHRYRYSLTLRAPSGKRLIGFDNAHPVQRLSGKFRKRSASSDHWHRSAADKGRPYAFTSPDALLEDFFREVERTLRELGADLRQPLVRKRR
jgi:hypothetical protein